MDKKIIKYTNSKPIYVDDEIIENKISLCKYMCYRYIDLGDLSYCKGTGGPHDYFPEKCDCCKYNEFKEWWKNNHIWYSYLTKEANTNINL